jgi:hypothetical protein
VCAGVGVAGATATLAAQRPRHREIGSAPDGNKEKPRAMAGLKFNWGRLNDEGTDWLKARPTRMVAGSHVDRNGCLGWEKGPKLQSLA